MFEAWLTIASVCGLLIGLEICLEAWIQQRQDDKRGDFRAWWE